MSLVTKVDTLVFVALGAVQAAQEALVESSLPDTSIEARHEALEDARQALRKAREINENGAEDVR